MTDQDQRSFSVIARCGDDALAGDATAEQDNGPVWAVLGRTQRRAVGSARTLRFTLSRDVAAAPTCAPSRDERDLAAAMIARRGHPPACHQTPPERTVFSSGRIGVTKVSQDGQVVRKLSPGAK